MIFETIVVANIVFIATKAVHTSVLENEKIKEKILKEGLYHITNEKSIDEIVKSGELVPGEDSRFFKKDKVYFFAGIPSWHDVCLNVNMFDLEMQALKINLNENQLNELTHRQFSDQAIAYDGIFKIPKSQIEIVDLVLDLDEKKEIIVKEKDNTYSPWDNEELTNKVKKGFLLNTYCAIKKEAKYRLHGIKDMAVYCHKKTSDNVTKISHNFDIKKR